MKLFTFFILLFSFNSYSKNLSKAQTTIIEKLRNNCVEEIHAHLYEVYVGATRDFDDVDGRDEFIGRSMLNAKYGFSPNTGPYGNDQLFITIETSYGRTPISLFYQVSLKNISNREMCEVDAMMIYTFRDQYSTMPSEGCYFDDAIEGQEANFERVSRYFGDLKNGYNVKSCTLIKAGLNDLYKKTFNK